MVNIFFISFSDFPITSKLSNNKSNTKGLISHLETGGVKLLLKHPALIVLNVWRNASPTIMIIICWLVACTAQLKLSQAQQLAAIKTMDAHNYLELSRITEQLKVNWSKFCSTQIECLCWAWVPEPPLEIKNFNTGRKVYRMMSAVNVLESGRLGCAAAPMCNVCK